MGTLQSGNPPCLPSGKKYLWCRNVGKNNPFAKGKSAVSPEARIHILRLQSIQTCALREGETGKLYISGRNFSGAETSEKFVI
jgi:hypothetical protein